MTFGEFRLSDPRGANLTAVLPVLPSRDLEKTAAFYSALGFATVLVQEGGGYLIIRKDWVELHFWPWRELDPRRNNVSVYLRVADVNASVIGMAERLAAFEGWRFLPPEDKPWGMRQASLIDPDGNLINIGTPRDHARWGMPD
jgi:catechol 2,3-dioxygenase-like lactoylglutathione lyase family enzyme